MSRLIDMTGQRFGYLTVVGRAENNAENRARWTVRCDCGTVKQVAGKALRRGETIGCGCRTGKNQGTHHQSNTRMYSIWHGVLARCYYAKARGFQDYGGRGIRVCDRWRDSFSAFVADVGERPTGEYSIDRIDNDGDYEPSNCRWATRTEQMRNSRLAKLNEQAAAVLRHFHGKKPAALLAGLHGISRCHVYDIQARKRWPPTIPADAGQPEVIE